MSETTDDYTYEKNRKFLVLLLAVSFVMSFGLPLISIVGKDLSLKYNPTVINGILTATAILFGFATNEIRQIKRYFVRLFILIPMMACLMLEVEFYLNDTLAGVNPTILTLYLSTAVFLLSLFIVVLATMIRELGL